MNAARATFVALVFLAACGSPEIQGQLPRDPSPPTRPAASAALEAPAPTPPKPPALAYPATKTVDAADVLHGVTVKDPYRWLEDPTSPEVTGWMRAEDDLARRELGKLPERAAIAGRLKELLYVDEIGVPVRRGDRYFYRRRRPDREKAIIYWRAKRDGEERTLIDPNAWAAEGNRSLGGFWPSDDGKRVIYQVHPNNADVASLYVMDVDTLARSKVDVFEGAKYESPVWTPKGDGFYYTWTPEDPKIPPPQRGGHAEIRFHKLGSDPKQDRVVRGATGDPTLFQGKHLSRDGRLLVVSVHHGWSADDVYYRDLKKPGGDGEWIPIVTGRPAHFDVLAHEGRFYIRTDDGAPRSRLYRVNPGHIDRASWEEIVAERADATLDDVFIFGGRLVLLYLKDASSRIEVRETDGKLVREVALPGLGTVSQMSGRADQDEMFYSFESFTVPSEVHVASIKTGKTELHARPALPVRPEDFVVEQAFYRSRDETRISMFIVRPKEMKKDGRARALLTGYGGFNISKTPTFTPLIFPWIERGGVYALANLRGGGEYGEGWHQAGMRQRKQNVFDDFIGAAEHLIHEGYTAPRGLTISGRSNGGLLVGAALTQRPDLFGAVICGVPLLDMVRYHRFGIGTSWISEYGSADDPDLFKALLGYSPYHHVTAGTRYPPVLMLSADSDDRVDPMHARKFAAALQAASAGGPVLLRIERASGHAGADLVKAKVELDADQVAFALAETGGGS